MNQRFGDVLPVIPEKNFFDLILRIGFCSLILFRLKRRCGASQNAVLASTLGGFGPFAIEGRLDRTHRQHRGVIPNL